MYNQTFLKIFIFLLLVGSSPFIVNSVDNQIISESQSKRLKINLICYKNDLGLSQDIEILHSELTKLEHFVNFLNFCNLTPPPKADINIFIDVVEEYFFPFADKNYLIPNPEWCFLSADKISQFDMILCKTREAQRIFNSLNSHVVYLGFTSKDRFRETIRKNYQAPFHLAGGSVQKGTYTLVKTWIDNPQFPSLILIKHKDYCYPPASNLYVVNKPLSDSVLAVMQNSCGLHFCPSETEGFGHYLMEALSCGSVVVTTDAPPMNEFVSDKRCLVEYNRTAPSRWATNYYIDPLKLEKTISTLLHLPLCELEEIGRKNREFYLENDRLFKQRLAEIFSSSSSLNAQVDLTENTFTHIYHNKLWGESPSGEGSMPENTQIYRYFLQNFLKDHSIQQVVDIGCGDWQISQLMDWTGIQYMGIDVFKEIIEKNQAQFSSPSIQFIHGNALHMDLPKADLLICKDVLQHLPNKEINLLFPQIQKFKHCLLINDVNPISLSSHNVDTFLGGYRQLDLTKSPFNLSGQKILTFVCGDVTKQVLYIRNID